MTIFAIILDEECAEAWKRVRTNWPDSHHIADGRLAFISTRQTTLTSDLSRDVGVASDSGIAGLVIQMDYYSGSTYRTTVEWLDKNK